jgi:hypothetical protein
MLKARAEACKAEYEAEVAEALTAHYPQSKAGTTSQGTNIINQALTTTPMGAAIPPPTHPTVAEALHQQSLALGIAPDPPGQVPLAPAAPVPALAPPVTLPAPVGASPGPPGDAEALHQQSLALGITLPDPQGQVPFAPMPLDPSGIAAFAPPVQPPALGLISAPLQLAEPVVCPAVHQPGHGEGPAEDSLSPGGSSVSISSQE